MVVHDRGNAVYFFGLVFGEAAVAYPAEEEPD